MKSVYKNRKLGVEVRVTKSGKIIVTGTGYTTGIRIEPGLMQLVAQRFIFPADGGEDGMEFNPGEPMLTNLQHPAGEAK